VLNFTQHLQHLAPDRFEEPENLASIAERWIQVEVAFHAYLVFGPKISDEHTHHFCADFERLAWLHEGPNFRDVAPDRSDAIDGCRSRESDGRNEYLVFVPVRQIGQSSQRMETRMALVLLRLMEFDDCPLRCGHSFEPITDSRPPLLLSTGERKLRSSARFANPALGDKLPDHVVEAGPEILKRITKQDAGVSEIDHPRHYDEIAAGLGLEVDCQLHGPILRIEAPGELGVKRVHVFSRSTELRPTTHEAITHGA
jgi:hypothetical protein